MSKRTKIGTCSNCKSRNVTVHKHASWQLCENCATKYLSTRLPLNVQVQHAARETEHIHSQTRVARVGDA